MSSDKGKEMIGAKLYTIALEFLCYVLIFIVVFTYIYRAFS